MFCSCPPSCNVRCPRKAPALTCPSFHPASVSVCAVNETQCCSFLGFRYAAGAHLGDGHGQGRQHLSHRGVHVDGSLRHGGPRRLRADHGEAEARRCRTARGLFIRRHRHGEGIIAVVVVMVGVGVGVAVAVAVMRDRWEFAAPPCALYSEARSRAILGQEVLAA